MFDCSDDRAVDEVNIYIYIYIYFFLLSKTNLKIFRFCFSKLARKIEDGDLHDLASYRYPEGTQSNSFIFLFKLIFNAHSCCRFDQKISGNVARAVIKSSSVGQFRVVFGY